MIKIKKPWQQGSSKKKKNIFMHLSTCLNLSCRVSLHECLQSEPCHATISAQQNSPKCCTTGYDLKSVWDGSWLTEDKWMQVVVFWPLPPSTMKRAGPLCKSRYHGECSSMEDVMQVIRVLGVAWFNARLLFAYAGIRDCFLRCQGWLALGGGWLGFP